MKLRDILENITLDQDGTVLQDTTGSATAEKLATQFLAAAGNKYAGTEGPEVIAKKLAAAFHQQIITQIDAQLQRRQERVVREPFRAKA